MKNLLVLTLLAVSGLSFSASTELNNVIEMGEKPKHYMSGSENCDGTTDFNSNSNINKILNGTGVILN